MKETDTAISDICVTRFVPTIEKGWGPSLKKVWYSIQPDATVELRQIWTKHKFKTGKENISNPDSGVQVNYYTNYCDSKSSKGAFRPAS
jgi:hypothetical protein